MLIVCNHSMAQNDSLAIANLPFNSFLTINSDSLKITKPQDSLIWAVDWKQIEKIDSTKMWKLISLKITYSGYHAGVSELHSTTKNRTYNVIDTLPEMSSDTLNKYFKLNESNIRLTRNWSYRDLSTNWTPFQNDNVLMISKRKRAIGNMYDSTIVYEYCFEEIE